MMNLGCTRRKHFCSFLRARCVLKPSLNHPATCCLIQLPSLPYPTLALPTPAPAQGRPRGWRAAASSLEYTNATCAKTGWAMLYQILAEVDVVIELAKRAKCRQRLSSDPIHSQQAANFSSLLVSRRHLASRAPLHGIKFKLSNADTTPRILCKRFTPADNNIWPKATHGKLRGSLRATPNPGIQFGE
eukprot:CAMPEP_0195630788 /NCGR_PEP_ID=MMETSP0815-20121206/20732_1 /TAXON_ID=97485 /ORGANISM="Prymnesium parvum, Strain Texoma1" /LENGTH=187 /DNA_ID=CAMNT_0040772273 /DNA_START=252 /DNA_END=816 /DNA_ORIENTATION=-